VTVPALSSLIRDTLVWVRLSSPLEATTLGIHDDDHRVDHLGFARRAQEEQLRDLLRRIPRYTNPDDRLDAAALRAHLMEILILTYQINLPERSAGYMIDEFLSALFHQVNGSYAPHAHRFSALLYRLREVQRMLGQVLHGLRKNAEAQRVPAAWTAQGMDVAAEGARYLAAIRRQLGLWLPHPQSALRRAVAEELTRAARALLEFRLDLRRRVLPLSVAGSYAVGRRRFGELLAGAHLLPASPLPFVHQARQEQRDISDQLRDLSIKLAGTPRWHEADRILSAEHPPAARLIPAFREQVRRLETFSRKNALTRLCGSGSLDVIETPVFERASIPYAAYQGPAPFEARARKGLFFVTPPDRRASRTERLRHLREFPSAAICVTAAHEGIPGHHLQHLMSHASDRPVRRLVWNTFFGEGWAHYAEGLVFREGYSDSDRSRFFLLKDRLWRCVRVGLDVDIHLHQLSLKEAAARLVREAGLSASGAWGEAVRYSQEPTQPMSYFVGRIFFESLVREERRRRGPAFDLARFHDRLLTLGAVPLALVRQRLNS